jgi:hypothetical protein
MRRPGQVVTSLKQSSTSTNNPRLPPLRARIKTYLGEIGAARFEEIFAVMERQIIQAGRAPYHYKQTVFASLQRLVGKSEVRRLSNNFFELATEPDSTD